MRSGDAGPAVYHRAAGVGDDDAEDDRGDEAKAALDGGRVVELSTHDELIAEGGHYAELFTIQASSYVDTA